MNFWQIVMLMLWFFLFGLWVWVLITLFIDVVRRSDLSGLAKAGWIVLVLAIPLVGVLAYVIARPSLTPRERLNVAEYENVVRPGSVETADAIAKLATLRAEGSITDEEYHDLKAKAMS